MLVITVVLPLCMHTVQGMVMVVAAQVGHGMMTVVVIGIDAFDVGATGALGAEEVLEIGAGAGIVEGLLDAGAGAGVVEEATVDEPLGGVVVLFVEAG